MSNNVKSNPLIQALTAMVIVGLLLMLALGDGDEKQSESQGGKPQPPPSYDTGAEELATVTGHLTRVESENKKLKDQVNGIDVAMAKLVTKEDLERLLNQNDTESESPTSIDVDQLTDVVAQKIESRIFEKLSGVISANRVGNVDEEIPDYGLDNLLDDGEGSPSAQWVQPLGHETEGGVADFLDNIAGLKEESSLSSFVSTEPSSKEEPQPVPYATIHADSAIFGATALNALIGRIEKKGVNTDPFEFSSILSGDTLMANGFSFPKIKDAMVSGVAVGDMAFQCVRGYITNITFIFNDGTIYQQKGDKETPLAKIADQWGNPCVKGEMVDDILKHVGIQSALAGVSSYSGLVAQQQQTLIDNSGSNGGTTSLALTGSAGKFAAGSITNGALDKTVEILGEQYESYYRAVYVKPGTKITLLFKQNINIDYDPVGRKVTYENFNNEADLAASYY